MKDFFEGVGLGAMITVAVIMFILTASDFQMQQYSYEQMHKGKVKCVDTPDNKVYCYQVDNTKGEKHD